MIFRGSIVVLMVLGIISQGAGQALVNAPAKAEAELPRPFPNAFAHAPTPIPDRIILTWAADPATTQAVTWRTDTSVKRGQAQITLSEPGNDFAPHRKKGVPDPEKVRKVAATTTLLNTNLGQAHYHSVQFHGLKPDTKYLYRVGDGVNWSEWFEFHTAKNKPARLRFIYLGDAQNDLKSHWSRVIRGAFSDMPKADFILHAGDLVNRDSADDEWGEWFYAGGWINGMIPCVATPGNHEYGPGKKLTKHWRACFTFPENGPPGLEETVYSIDIQGVRLISLNSNEQVEEQVPWLEAQLKQNPQRWTIVTFHHPIYSTARGRDNPQVRKHWRPLFDRYGVDLVLQGHDHTYGRSGLMREDNLLEGINLKDQGTVYVVSVSGPKMYTLEPRPWMVSSAMNTQLYQLITVDGDRLHFESRTANGSLYDEFELRKTASGRNQLVERSQLDRERQQVIPVPSSAEDSSSQTGLAIGVLVALAAMATVLRAARFGSL